MSGKRVLVTGGAGFIGSHTVLKLLERGDEVLTVDNFNPYYDVKLKRDRAALFKNSVETVEGDLADKSLVAGLFKKFRPTHVVHLAAQPGVRYSITHPDVYISANITAFQNILEACRHQPVAHLVFASSSSVYGANRKLPFAVGDSVDHPLSLYAATKKANELMAHTYSHLFRIPATGLRFFTVYGPWGRPDMAPFKFTEAIIKGQKIDVYNHGNLKRDFTFVDDIVEGVVRTMDKPAEANRDWDPVHPDPSTSDAPYRLYNIGNNKPVPLMEFIATLESLLGKEASKEYLPMQPGDVLETFADIDALVKDVGFKPETTLRAGLEKFVGWYREYYKV
jgi:UDP-glucuronate 4-epimerase